MSRPPGSPKGWGYIYFLYAEEVGRVKIGYAQDVARRIGDIQNMSPCELTLLGTVRARYEEEAFAHAHFRGHRLHGEWFTLTNEMREIAESGKFPWGVLPNVIRIRRGERPPSSEMRVSTVKKYERMRAYVLDGANALQLAKTFGKSLAHMQGEIDEMCRLGFMTEADLPALRRLQRQGSVHLAGN